MSQDRLEEVLIAAVEAFGTKPPSLHLPLWLIKAVVKVEITHTSQLPPAIIDPQTAINKIVTPDPMIFIPPIRSNSWLAKIPFNSLDCLLEIMFPLVCRNESGMITLRPSRVAAW